MLPPTPLPIRPKLREWLIAACVTSLVTLLLWTGIGYVRDPHYSPDFMTGLEALKDGHGKEAMGFFKYALQSNPSDPDPYQTICKKAIETKQWEVAAQYAQQGLQNCPQAPREIQLEFYEDWTTAVTEARQPGWQKTALEAALGAYKLAPNDPLVMNRYAYTLTDANGDANSLTQAHDLLKNALEILGKMPDTPDVKKLRAVTQDSYGWTLYKQGDYAHAIEPCQTSVDGLLAVDPSNVDLKTAYYHLGAAHRLNGEIEEARSSLNSALFLDANYKDAQDELAKIK